MIVMSVQHWLCIHLIILKFFQFSNPDLPGYVGFANLPNQIHRKSVKRGFEFTLMVVGESGLGKSTLINTLFLTDLYPDRVLPSAQESISKTVKIDVSTVEIEERGVKVRLTVVDTPGYGDAIDNTDCFQSIIQYINDQFERYLQDESGLNRRHIVDNRVHCCFYFINPAGHGLKPLDIQFMKQLHNKVNIVPVIAKADTLTKQEVQKLKRKVLDEIGENDIHIYPLPDCDTDEEEDYKEQVRQLKEAVPFAVVGSTTVLDVGGKKVRGRQYPWGVIEVENPSHCDFIKLRCLLGTHMQDLTEVTQDVHYENYRSERLAKGGSPITSAAAVAANNSINSHGNSVTVAKGKLSSLPGTGPEKDRMAMELEEKEAQIRRMQEMMAKMQAQLQDKK
ncbi:septin-2B-like isoform X2 [Macrobrachium nipponense]|uniref:septin-2B-like isoform X2 n=1 Tax=Macrobrachium nipponense TaxID=159736 RepID=UPI0030C85382